MRLSVVLPAYNEERSIGTVLSKLGVAQDKLKRLNGIEEVEIIVVDDGSTDSTAAVARSSAAMVRVISHPTNKGYGAALKTGLRAASGLIIAFMDSDGTYASESLPDLVEVFLSGGYDMVTGSRRMTRPVGMPLARRLGNWLFYVLASAVTGKRITDSTSGMRVIGRPMLDLLDELPDDLSFALVMTLKAARTSLRVTEVPIPYHERIGRSKLSWARDGYTFALRIMES